MRRAGDSAVSTANPPLFPRAGQLTDELKTFLTQNLPAVKAGKKPKYSVGVGEPKIGAAILDATGIPCESNDRIGEARFPSLSPTFASAPFSPSRLPSRPPSNLTQPLPFSGRSCAACACTSIAW